VFPFAQMLMDNHPRIASARQNSRAAADSRRRSAAHDSGPLESINARGDIRGLGNPHNVADPIVLVLDGLEVVADRLFDRGLADMAAAVAEPVDRIFIDQLQCMFKTVVTGGGLVLANELGFTVPIHQRNRAMR